jgi:hypothetical protein
VCSGERDCLFQRDDRPPVDPLRIDHLPRLKNELQGATSMRNLEFMRRVLFIEDIAVL